MSSLVRLMVRIVNHHEEGRTHEEVREPETAITGPPDMMEKPLFTLRTLRTPPVLFLPARIPERCRKVLRGRYVDYAPYATPYSSASAAASLSRVTSSSVSKAPMTLSFESRIVAAVKRSHFPPVPTNWKKSVAL